MIVLSLVKLRLLHKTNTTCVDAMASFDDDHTPNTTDSKGKIGQPIPTVRFITRWSRASFFYQLIAVDSMFRLPVADNLIPGLDDFLQLLR